MSSPTDPVHDPFGRSQLPAGFDRAGRVQQLAEVAAALQEGREPPRDAALFVGGALTAWLQQGGDLLRDYLRVKAPRASTHTPAAIYRSLQGSSSRRATCGADADSLKPVHMTEVSE